MYILLAMDISGLDRVQVREVLHEVVEENIEH